MGSLVGEVRFRKEMPSGVFWQGGALLAVAFAADEEKLDVRFLDRHRMHMAQKVDRATEVGASADSTFRQSVA